MSKNSSKFRQISFSFLKENLLTIDGVTTSIKRHIFKVVLPTVHFTNAILTSTDKTSMQTFNFSRFSTTTEDFFPF